MKPADLGLPEKFQDWRPQQLQSAHKIASSSRYSFLLDSPTGTGKSLIAVTSSKLLGKKAVIVVRTKQLQQQYLDDFPDAMLLKGRVNYPCAKVPRMFPKVTAEDCTNTKDSPCEDIGRCQYLINKRQALAAPITILNQAYLLTESNYVGGFGKIPFLVLDEADTIEHGLMNFVQLVITQRMLDRLGVSPPRFKTKFESWVEWGEQAKRVVSENLAAAEDNLPYGDEWETIDYNVLRKRKELNRLYERLSFFASNVDQNWVWYPEEERWTFKPVWISKYAKSVLWKHAEAVLGMSATILLPQLFSNNIGLEDYDYLALSSPFPRENRPIYYRPVANVKRKAMAVALPKLAKAVSEILKEHPGKKGLCHTVSYDVANYLASHVDSKRLIVHHESDRADKLQSFKSSSRPLVMISPSMDRGVDLPYDDCRFIIICKVPYPNLNDPQISKRLYSSKDGKRWYAWETVCTLIQMCGRGVRSKEDFCETYILDEQFERVYSGVKGLFPEWWTEALVK